MSTDKKIVFDNLAEAFSRPIKDEKKIECYDYFLEHIKPHINKSDYCEQFDRNRGIVNLVMSPDALSFEHMSTLLGIIMS
jgi:hypothetical protein